MAEAAGGHAFVHRPSRIPQEPGVVAGAGYGSVSAGEGLAGGRGSFLPPGMDTPQPSRFSPPKGTGGLNGKGKRWLGAIGSWASSTGRAQPDPESVLLLVLTSFR